MSWSQFKPWVDTAAIITGVATAITVASQLYDINSREKQKGIQEWQTAIVYEVIENGRDVNFDQINDKYVIAAKQSKLAIPVEALSPAALRLVLVDLIRSQAVIETANYRYSARLYADPVISVATAMAASNNMTRNIARHVAIGWKSLSAVRDPVSEDELKNLMIKDRADEKFLADNMPIVLQQMQMQGYAKLVSGGRVMPGDNVGGSRNAMFTIPPSLEAIKGKLDPILFRLAMTIDPDNATSTCFPNAKDWERADNYRKAHELNLISWSEQTQTKECFKNLMVTPLPGILDLRGLAFGATAGILSLR